MGITGLLPALKSITETKEIAKYQGKTLAIDGYCWLHRGIYGCSTALCLGQDTNQYINYFLDRVRTLLNHGVIPYVVFDGGPLPMKKGTEDERRKARAENRERGLECYRQKRFSEARKYFVRAADVTPYMAHRVICGLRVMNVKYVVAPYEADAQLTFLMKQGLVDGVITEDSDCLPFGCHTVLFKCDRDGIAQEIQLENLQKNTTLSLNGFTHDMFLEMCILSGCDYLSNLPGVGLKKAYILIKQHRSVTKVLRALRLEGNIRIPLTYAADFERALLTFRHQRVYDPVSEKIVALTPIPEELEGTELEFLGPILPSEVGNAIARGEMDPITKEYFNPTTIRHLPAKPLNNELQTKTASTTIKTTGRSFPLWISKMTSPTTPFTQRLHSRREPPTPLSKPISTSSNSTSSRYFVTNKSTSNDYTTNTGDNQPPEIESTYESQESKAVDIACNIPFSPAMDDDKKAQTQLELSKENSPSVSNPTAPPEDAFTRMLRAGSTYKSQKRPLRSVSNNIKRQKRSLFSTPSQSVKSLPLVGLKHNTIHIPSKDKFSTMGESDHADPSSPDSDKCNSPVTSITSRTSNPVVRKKLTFNTPKAQVPTRAFAQFRFQQSKH